MRSTWRTLPKNVDLRPEHTDLGLKQSHSMRTNNSPIAIMRRSCSDSSPTASQLDWVFGSDRYAQFNACLDSRESARMEFSGTTRIKVKDFERANSQFSELARLRHTARRGYVGRERFPLLLQFLDPTVKLLAP